MARLPVRENRRITFIKAFMAVGEGWADVTIANVSQYGMMVKCNEPPEKGTVVTIRRRAAAASGTVQWVNGRRFGVLSRERIDLDSFAAESAADVNRCEKAAVARPRVIDRLWHWRSRG